MSRTRIAVAVAAAAVVVLFGFTRSAKAELEGVNGPCTTGAVCQSGACSTNYNVCCPDGTDEIGLMAGVGSSCSIKADCGLWDCDPTNAGNHCCTPAGGCASGATATCQIDATYGEPLSLASCTSNSQCCSGLCMGEGSAYCKQVVQGICKDNTQCSTGYCTNDGYGVDAGLYRGTCLINNLGGGTIQCKMDQDCAPGTACNADSGACFSTARGACTTDDQCVNTLCIGGWCEIPCTNDVYCENAGLPRCEGTCCSTLHQACRGSSDCCSTDGPGDGGASCNNDRYPNYDTCCVPDGGACGSTADCCQPSTSYTNFSPTRECVAGTCQSCVAASQTSQNHGADCCSSVENNGTGLCCVPPSTQGCSTPADCCPGPNGSVMLCGGNPSESRFIATNFPDASVSLDGYGFCCEEQGSTCTSSGQCCDGYCVQPKNDAGMPIDAGICQKLHSPPVCQR